MVFDVGGFFGGLLNAGVRASEASANAAINHQNLMFQREAFNYQKHLNELQMSREDNAVQRRVADLKAAGLSPVLAAGSAAESHSHSTAPAPQRAALDLQGLNVIGSFLQAIQQKENIAQTQAETELVQEKVASEKQDRDVRMQDFVLRQHQDMREAQKLKNEIYGLSLEEQRIAMELARLGYDGERLRHEAQRVANDSARVKHEATRVFNDGERIALQKARDQILNDLDASRKGLIDQQTLTEHLRQTGLSWDTVLKTVQYEHMVYNLLLSENLGYRTTDNLSTLERIAPTRAEAAIRARGTAQTSIAHRELVLKDDLRRLRALVGGKF